MPVASSEGYNLVGLVDTIVEVLPNEKKYAFTREAKQENVSEESAIKAEQGIVDFLKAKVGQAWDYVKADLADLVVENARKYAPILVKAGLDWLKRRF